MLYSSWWNDLVLVVFHTAQSRNHKKIILLIGLIVLKLHCHFCFFEFVPTINNTTKDKVRSTLSLSMTSDKGGSEKRITATMVLVGAMSKPPCSLVICSTVVPVDCILVFIPGQNVEDVRNQDYWLVSQLDAYCHTSSNFSSIKNNSPQIRAHHADFFTSEYVFRFMCTFPCMTNWKKLHTLWGLCR